MGIRTESSSASGARAVFRMRVGVRGMGLMEAETRVRVLFLEVLGNGVWRCAITVACHCG